MAVLHASCRNARCGASMRPKCSCCTHALHMAMAVASALATLTFVKAHDFAGVLLNQRPRPGAEVLPHKLRVLYLWHRNNASSVLENC